MPNELTFERISLSEVKTKLTDKRQVECRTEVDTESVNKLLNVSSTCAILETNATNQKVSYGGKAVFYLCYEDSDGNIKKCECGTEFLGSVDYASDKQPTKIKADCDVIKIESDASGIRLVVTATIKVTLCVMETNNLSLLSGGESLVCDLKEIEYLKGYGAREAGFNLEEDVDLPYAVGEVLYHRATPILTAVQCGVGVIICDGEVRLSAILLQTGEKSDIIREEKALPFRVEIECEEAMPTMTATASVKLKSFKTDVKVDKEKNLSLVSVSVGLIFTGEAFSLEKISIADDLFSLTEKIKFKKKDCLICSPQDERVCEVEVEGVALTDDLPENSTLKAVGGEKAQLISAKNTDDGLLVTGVLSATGYFINGEGKFFTRKLETPFEKLASCPLNSDDEFDVYIKTENASGKIISTSEALISAHIILSVCPTARNKITYIEDAISEGEKEVNENAISVYIAFEGETLFSLAKRLNTPPEILQETNKDLSFPLSSEERIVVYRQKNG